MFDNPAVAVIVDAIACVVCAVIVGATIPFALFFAIGLMVVMGESANLLSVGAIDFGLIVDATVLMVEAIFSRLRTMPGFASSCSTFRGV